MDIHIPELERHIDKDKWVVHFGRDDGMLVNGLYDVMFEIFLNLKLMAFSHGENFLSFSVSEPSTLTAGDFYDTKLGASIPLSVLVGAGPEILASLRIDRDPQFRKHVIDLDASHDKNGVFTLSGHEVRRIEEVIGTEDPYCADLCRAIIHLTDLSGVFCRECHNALSSSYSKKDVVDTLIFSYYTKANICASKNYLDLMP